MTDLADFLLARIAEDERDARDAANYCPDDGPFVRWDSDRVLTECEAKRRIVEQFTMIKLLDEWHDAGPAEGAYVKMQTVLALLALPYADHPDYHEEWKP